MKKDDIIYKLAFSFQDLMDLDDELREEFEKLDELEQEDFMITSQSSISGGMNEGTDFSTVMRIVANLLAEELINKRKRKDDRNNNQILGQSTII